MPDIIKMGLKLLLITSVAAFALGLTYLVTEEPIALQIARANTEARMAVLPGASEFEPVDFAQKDYPQILEIFEGHLEGEPIGYTLKVSGKGYGGTLEVIVGIGKNGIIEAVRVGSHQETPGLGAKALEPRFRDQFKGLATDRPIGDEDVSAITGATITSKAVTQAVNAAITCLKNEGFIGGGS